MDTRILISPPKCSPAAQTALATPLWTPSPPICLVAQQLRSRSGHTSNPHFLHLLWPLPRTRSRSQCHPSCPVSAHASAGSMFSIPSPANTQQRRSLGPEWKTIVRGESKEGVLSRKRGPLAHTLLTFLKQPPPRAETGSCVPWEWLPYLKRATSFCTWNESPGAPSI